MKAALVAAVAAVFLAATSTGSAAGNAIAANPTAPTTTSGVSFTVSANGGNRNFASVSVTCSTGGTTVYETVLNVQLDASGTGTSQTIFPPASSCTADLLKQMSIGKAHVLGSVAFVVAP
jgi:hypothetical protein